MHKFFCFGKVLFVTYYQLFCFFKSKFFLVKIFSYLDCNYVCFFVGGDVLSSIPLISPHVSLCACSIERYEDTWFVLPTNIFLS